MEQPSSLANGADFTFDVDAGEIRDGDIRYLLMRPDVLMGVVRNLDEDSKIKVLRAFEKSAFENGKASLLHYRSFDFSSTEEALSFLCKTSEKLGWGSWAHRTDKDGNTAFSARNSPFAAGYGQSDRPVCAPITGILRAAVEIFLAKDAFIEESSCAAQGADECQFEVRFPP